MTEDDIVFVDSVVEASVSVEEIEPVVLDAEPLVVVDAREPVVVDPVALEPEAVERVRESMANWPE